MAMFRSGKRVMWCAYRSIVALSLAAVLCVPAPLPTAAQGTGVTQINSRAALAGNDFIDWGQLGTFVPNSPVILFNLTSQTVTSHAGLSATLTGHFAQDQQAPTTAGCNCWNGNFAPNDYVVFADEAVQLTLTFATPVSGVGTQFGEDGAGPFTASMSLKDPNGNLIGALSESGVMTSAGDNSAIFLGATSVTPIKSVTFAASPVPAGAFAINRVELKTSASTGFADDFEAPTLSSAWTASGIGSATLSTAFAHSGQQSLNLRSSPNFDWQVNVRHDFGSAQTGDVTAWVLGPDCCPLGSAIGMQIEDGNRWALLVQGGNSQDPSLFTARINPGTPEIDRAIQSSASSWHKFEIVTSATGVSVRLDGQEIESDPSITSFTAVDFTEWGGPSGSAFVDDFSFTPAGQVSNSSNSVTLSFDTVSVPPAQCIDATNFLAGSGISYSGPPQTSPIICNAAPGVNAAIPTSAPNYFEVRSAPGQSNAPLTYTLHFSTAVSNISFFRTGIINVSTGPAWTATAFTASGQQVGNSVGEGRTFGPAAQRFTIAGSGITSLQIAANNEFATFTTPPIDDLTFTPSGCNGAIVSGVAQSGTTLLPSATVNLFSGTSLVATTTADPTTAAYTFSCVASANYTVSFTLGSLSSGEAINVTPGAGTISPPPAPPTLDLANHSWPNAYRLNPLGSPGSPVTVDEDLSRQDQSAWFKFKVQPGSKVVVQLTNLPATYDLTLYKDIAAAFSSVVTPQDLARLDVEAAPEAFAPEAFAPEAFAPEAFAPEAFAPEAFAPEAFAPEAFAPEAFAPEAFAPGEAVAPEAFASAQTRSLIGVSVGSGTTPRLISRDTWSNDGDFYVRVRGRNGAFSLASPFRLQVSLLTGGCAPVSPITTSSSTAASSGRFKSIIVTDSHRMAGSVADMTTLQARLEAFRQRPEVAGVVVDVGNDARVQAAHTQADANPACPFAVNLVAQSIKDIIDAYRAINPLQYVVLVGNDDVIPFFRDPDRADLASETGYVPPVLDPSESFASLNLGYVLSQDRYGERFDMSVQDHTFPIPQLAVGRLVETPADATAAIDAYLTTANGVTPITTPALTTGYDFMARSATAINAELSAGMGLQADSLIEPGNLSPQDSAAWNADQLRSKLLGTRHDLIFLGGHFSAGSALAADFQTRLDASEVLDAPVNLANSIIFSLGCHSGYNVPDQDAVTGVTAPVDFAEAFNHKGASLIAGTGYQYGDTDFNEYGGRLYTDFSHQLRMSTDPVSIGNALVAAKLDYLAHTAQLRGIDEKTLMETTLFGLPQLSVKMPGSVGPEGDPLLPTSVTPVAGGPGVALGLLQADAPLAPALTTQSAPVRDVTRGVVDTATYVTGANGVVANPAEPVLPLELHNASVAPGLRGVVFTSGTYTDTPDVLPLTGAPATEIRGVHGTFQSDVFFPVRPWNLNFFDAVRGGETRLAVTPAQFRSDGPGSTTGTLRKLTNLSFRFFYSINTGPAALAAAPGISDVTATPGAGNALTFSARVTADPAAGVEGAWITYTAVSGPLYGKWQSVQLSQSTSDPTLWTGSLGSQQLGASSPSDVRYFVQAVSGVGLVGMDTNLGAYYTPATAIASVQTPKQSVNLAFLQAPSSGNYRDAASFAVLATSNGAPLAGDVVTFDLGNGSQQAVTGANGIASATLTLVSSPGTYTLRASSDETTQLLPAAATTPFMINPQTTRLSLTQATPGPNHQPTLVLATLRDNSAEQRYLDQQSVLFVVTGGAKTYTSMAITNYEGQAPLQGLALAEGTYTVSAYFGKTVQAPGGPLAALNTGGYAATSASITLTLTPPSTLATPSPGPDPAGWNNTPVTVGLNATTSGPAQVQQISYSTSGGQAGGGTFEGASGSVTVSAAGITTLSYFATDTFGEQETPKTLNVRIDRIPPTINISGIVNGTTYDNSVVPAVVIQDLNMQGTVNQTSGVDVSKSTVTLDGQPFQTGTPVTTIGSHILTVNATDLAGNGASSTVSFRIKHTTTISYTGAVSSDYNDQVTTTATLIDTGLSPAAPVAGEPVRFSLGGGAAAPSCSGTTDQTGAVSCPLTPNEAAGLTTLTASFAGDGLYEASSANAQFAVTREETNIQVTSSPTLPTGGVLVKASLLEDSQTPVSGQNVTFTAGGASATGTTDSTGAASALLALPPGQYTLTASFNGDPFHIAANSPRQTMYVYEPTQFVIWGGNAGGVSAGHDYPFWGKQWAKQVTGGSYNGGPSFKGYASQVDESVWTSEPGNSSNPPGSVATFIGVLVSTNITKQGNLISGNATEMVVLRVDDPAAYQPDPGHSGSGIIMTVVQ